MNTNNTCEIAVFSCAEVFSISFNLRYVEIASSVASIDFTFIHKYWKQILLTKVIKLLVLLFCIDIEFYLLIPLMQPLGLHNTHNPYSKAGCAY